MAETVYPRAVVALAGARDHYQLPLGLEEGDLLETLVTDLYWPTDQKWFAPAKALLPERALEGRVCAGLPSSRVRTAPGAFAAAAMLQASRRLGAFNRLPSAVHRLNRTKDRLLGQTAGQLAARSHAALFCYSYYAYHAFHSQKNANEHRFLFQVHPHPQAVRQILLEELEAVPQARESLEREYELGLPEEDLAHLTMEPLLANGWVVASSYTAQTLAAYGIPRERVYVVPYGVDHRLFANRTAAPRPTTPFTVVFAGSMVQRKGLAYLLEAIRLLGARRIRVVLCGRGFVDASLLAEYDDLTLQIRQSLPGAELVRQMQSSDVFVLPSLAEGFGHVILEAMSCGVPVIATQHTCAPDVMLDGQQGFIVPIRDARAIAEKLAWGLDHRDELAAMGQAAAAQARRFTWARFRKGIRDAYTGMIAAATHG
jgi:glycosyltransferase involved in cell wall biosynthesis